MQVVLRFDGFPLATRRLSGRLSGRLSERRVTVPRRYPGGTPAVPGRCLDGSLNGLMDGYPDGCPVGNSGLSDLPDYLFDSLLRICSIPVKDLFPYLGPFFRSL
jgi:hypothetical protein